MINYNELTNEELQKIAKECLKQIQMRKLTEGRTQ